MADAYDPAHDAAASYNAAIEAKRQRGDTHGWEGRPWKRMEKIGDCTLVGFQSAVSVYAIRSVEGVTVYVGSTRQDIRHRVRAHLKEARDGSSNPIHEWMRANACRFEVVFLEACKPSERVERERFWIASFQNLLNMTDGGPGMSGNKFAGTGHAQKIADKLKRGTNFSCEVCSASFWRKPRDVKRGHTRFCSRACYQTWQVGRPKTRAPE